MRPDIHETFERKCFVDTTDSGNMVFNRSRNINFGKNLAMKYIHIYIFLNICIYMETVLLKYLKIYLYRKKLGDIILGFSKFHFLEWQN